MPELFEEKSPCKSCPYRKDAKLAFWSRDEFKDLLVNEVDYFGATYLCHQKNGSICVGFLMNQDARGFPSIRLRMLLSKNDVTREYLDSLNCESEMFETVEEMVEANFPA